VDAFRNAVPIQKFPDQWGVGEAKSFMLALVENTMKNETVKLG
jgi:hypothetical protein